MAVSKPVRPRAKRQLAAKVVADPVGAGASPIGRLVTETMRAVAQLDSDRASRTVVDVVLALGINRVTHGLGRVARGYSLTPSVLDASFAHRKVTSNATTIDIEVSGTAGQSATIELY